MTASRASGRLHTVILGQTAELARLVAELERCDDVEVVARGETAEEVGSVLATIDVDVVLLATPAHEFPARELAALREHVTAPVILLASAEAPELLERALEADVADALLMPQPPQSVLFAIRKAVGARGPALATRATGRTITVFSPKGGTGKSVTATNLAAVSAEERRRTLLLDLDLQFGDCAVMLGLQPERTVLDLVTASGELDAEKLAGYVTRHASGLDLLAAPKRPEDAELVSIGGLARLFDVAKESYDVVVVDTAPFLHGPTLTAIDHSDTLVLVAILDVPTLKDVRQSLETLELISFPAERVSLLLNKADAPVGITRGDVEAAFERRFEYALPEDRSVPLSVNRSAPAVLAEPRSEYVRALRATAASLLAQAVPRASSVEVRR